MYEMRATSARIGKAERSKKRVLWHRPEAVQRRTRLRLQLQQLHELSSSSKSSDCSRCIQLYAIQRATFDGYT
jgi:hypothetical protein